MAFVVNLMLLINAYYSSWFRLLCQSGELCLLLEASCLMARTQEVCVDHDEDLFSVEERLLFETPDEEIIARNKKYSFDVQSFDSRISTGDAWQRIVQGHLFFEHVVGQLLLEALTKPEAISLSRMGYSQRLDLASAMGILSDEQIVALRKINSLRNKLAHDLNFEITEQDVLDLANCTPREMRAAIQRDKGVDACPLDLYDLLMGNLVMLESRRQENAASKELRRKHFLKMRFALDNYRRVRAEIQTT